jgi:hypothetical protein
MIHLNTKDFVLEEFKNLDLGDLRLNKRLTKVASAMNNNPSFSIPQMIGDDRYELKAFYSFFQNEKITDQKLLQAHYKNTIERCQSYQGKILLLSDSTFVTPQKYFKGLKDQGKGKKNCLRVHYVLAVSSDRKHIFGMLDFRIISDKLSKTSIQLKDESDIWILVARTSVNRILQIENGKKLLESCVYITDREGDEYDLMKTLKEIGLRFIIRSQYDRVIFCNDEEAKISSCEKLEVKHGRPYLIKTRSGQGKTREASVQRSILSDLSINPPNHKEGPVIDDLNIVLLREIDTDLDINDQVFWRLITTEDVSKASDSSLLVNYYAIRWVIEEMNKCAKMGAGAEERQFQDLDHFTPFLAIVYVIGWRLLATRNISETDGGTHLEKAFTEDEVNFFKAVSEDHPDDEILTVADAINYIAGLGGFTRTYERPGWIILWRGWMVFSHQVTGYSFAQRKLKRE